MGAKNFMLLFISIPKCIELNYELILGLVPHPGPKANTFFLVKCLKLTKNYFVLHNLHKTSKSPWMSSEVQTGLKFNER